MNLFFEIFRIFKKLRLCLNFLLVILVSREGLEPSTPCLRGRCSNQLSYRPRVVHIIISHIAEK